MTSAEETVHGSPLLEIQCCEAEVVSLVNAADEAAATRLKKVGKQAAGLRQRAADIGRAEGEAEYEKLLSEARAGAARLLEQAHDRTDVLRLNRGQYVEAMVKHTLEIIVELEKETTFA